MYSLSVVCGEGQRDKIQSWRNLTITEQMMEHNEMSVCKMSLEE